MISKAIKDKIGDILDIIDQLAPDRNRLVEIYEAYSNPLSFINKYLRDFPSSSRAVAGMIYRAVRYLSRQDEVLPLQGFDQELDRRLAGQIPMPGDRPDLAYAFRYNLQFNVTSNDGSFVQNFNLWVNNGGLLSEKELLTISAPAIASLVDRYRLTLEQGFHNSARITTSEIRSFVQYIPDLNRG